ncbi:MAG: hypothetical protein KDC82_07735, partial [Bacteroidetes bacterium]|nr:hypothetical protein [Bacteroidota bacterium]
MKENQAQKSVAPYISPDIRYYKTRKEFDIAVGEDFIQAANAFSKTGIRFLVGLSHGLSPSGAYQYILDNYSRLKKPELLRYTFVNSPLRRQRDLQDAMDARAFLNKLLEQGLLDEENILGSALVVRDIESYAVEFNERLIAYMERYEKTGLDYVFVATNPEGHVAGIERKSDIF